MENTFRGLGMRLVNTYTAIEALHLIRTQRFEAVVVSHPTGNHAGRMETGAFLEAARRHTMVPIVVYGASTASLIEEFYRGGADRHITSEMPDTIFALDLKALLRRSSFEETARLHVGDVVYDMKEQRVLVGGAPVTLCQGELVVLEYLMQRAGVVAERNQMCLALCGQRETETRAIDLRIARLRRALGGPSGKYIETVWGRGYRFRRLSPS